MPDPASDDGTMPDPTPNDESRPLVIEGDESVPDSVIPDAPDLAVTCFSTSSLSFSGSDRQGYALVFLITGRFRC
jgi:hypothetical protein